jgi:type II secretory pathway component PulF
MALINAKNGQMAVAAAFAAAQLANQALNAWRAKDQAKGLAEGVSPEFKLIKEQLDVLNSANSELKKTIDEMQAQLTKERRQKFVFSILSFVVGLAFSAAKFFGVAG